MHSCRHTTTEGSKKGCHRRFCWVANGVLESIIGWAFRRHPIGWFTDTHNNPILSFNNVIINYRERDQNTQTFDAIVEFKQSDHELLKAAQTAYGINLYDQFWNRFNGRPDSKSRGGIIRLSLQSQRQLCDSSGESFLGFNPASSCLEKSLIQSVPHIGVFMH
jgi:hypothetical protein